MDRITGTLKYYSKTRKGTAQLTGNWDNGKDKVWVTWDEAQPLRDAELVYEHSVETWDDGSKKWKVNGEPEITLEVEHDGRDTFTKVCVNSWEPDAEAATPRGVSLDAKAAYFSQCLEAARDIWTDESGGPSCSEDVLYKTAFTLYKG